MQIMNTYAIPAAPVMTEELVKKSRFITYLGHTDNVDAARAFIRRIKSEHPAAAHHCWAHIAGAPWDSQVLGFSDDGEPSGTAGKPMLAQLQGSAIGEISAVVVRYFGGIELGTGGLVKAYGQGVQTALKQLTTLDKVPMQAFNLQVAYTILTDITHLIQRYEGQVTGQRFEEMVSVDFMLPVAHIDSFNRHVSDLSRGSLQLPLSDIV